MRSMVGSAVEGGEDVRCQEWTILLEGKSDRDRTTVGEKS